MPGIISEVFKASANFYLREFACTDGTPVPGIYMDNVKTLAIQLEVIRRAAGCPLLINSGFRTPIYNRKIGGKSKSQHLVAKAVDLHTRHHTPKELHKLIIKLIKAGEIIDGGVGLYPSFVHYDIGPAGRRWADL